jgi:hypothetical protein
VKDPPASFVDVTAEVTRRVLGKAAGYVVGMDFQRTPHMSAAVYKFFRDPEAADPGEIIPWIVDECIREDSDEYELLDQLEAMPRWQATGRDEARTYRGWIEPSDDKVNPAHCAVVMDASAWWQDGDLCTRLQFADADVGTVSVAVREGFDTRWRESAESSKSSQSIDNLSNTIDNTVERSRACAGATAARRRLPEYLQQQPEGDLR